MKHLLEVCLVALTLSGSLVPSLAAENRTADAAPPLQKGIHVEMAVTRYAVAVPEADEEDALIVAITRDGRTYLRIDPVSAGALGEKVKAILSNQAEKKLYLKADARTAYANVAAVLESARDAESLVLLTSQPEPAQPGARVPPKGLEVRVGSRPQSGPDAIVVDLGRPGQQRPKVTINNKPVPWASLRTTLADLLRNQAKKVVLVNADGALPFSDVVTVTDQCRSIKAAVVLVRPQVEP
jgi:biopolymer transport protein ExbD